MRFLFLFSFVLTTLFSNSQIEEKHFIGGGFSPEACFRTIEGNLGAKNESYGFGFSSGLTYQYNIKWFVGLETGLYFSDKGYTVDYSPYSFGDQIDPRRGFIYNQGSQMNDVKLDMNLFYLDVPIKFNFYFINSWVKPFVGLGVLNNIYLTSGRDYRSYNRSSFMRSYGLQGVVSLGVDFNFSKAITFRIEPQFKHSIISVWNSSFQKEYPFSIGCMVGLYYRFGEK
jgi:hypothetical protein